MTTRVLTASQRTEAEATWQALEAEIPDAGLMCSWTWTGTWLAHYGDAVDHRFILAQNERGPRGIALITRQAGLSRLRPPTIAIGTAGEPAGSSVFVERNRLLVRPAERQAFATALMTELARDRSWQRLRLDGMVLDDAEALLGGRTGVSWNVEESPFTDLLADGRADVLDALPARRRQRVKQTLRRFGVLETGWECAPGEILDELIALHEARWQADGLPGAFASKRFEAFHRELIGGLAPTDGAALFRVRRGSETVACLYGLRDGRRMLFYQAGLQRYEDNRLRAGIAAHALFMQACRDRGLAEYHFLAPATRYKRDLATSSDRLVWAELGRPGVRLHLESVARRVKHRLRRSKPA